MVSDEILFLVREYIDKHRGQPKCLHMSADNYARLLEERGLDPEYDMQTYHGMYIEITYEKDTDLLEIE